MKILIKIKKSLKNIGGYAVDEFMKIATSYSILLVMIGGVFIYGLLYNYMYQPNLVRKVPIALVDDSQTPLSREYARLLNAASQVEIYATVSDFPAAKKLMKEEETVGIVYIPKDFDRLVGRGEQAIFVALGNTSAFLNFVALEEAAGGAMATLDARLNPDMVSFVSLESLYAMSLSHPIIVSANALYNYTEGYGSYLIPAVFIIIIFQTLLMIVAMITGGERHDKTILKYAKNGLSFGSMSEVVLSRTFVYSVLYAIFAYFLIGLLPHIFSIPNIGNTMDIVVILIPFILGTCFFGFACSVIFADSESPILMIAFFSLGYIFLSGVSYPLELMPWYWQAAHSLVPASPAVLAYVKINSMGATLANVQTEYITLWIQCIVYFILACFAVRYNIRKVQQEVLKQ